MVSKMECKLFATRSVYVMPVKINSSVLLFVIVNFNSMHTGHYYGATISLHKTLLARLDAELLLVSFTYTLCLKEMKM